MACRRTGYRPMHVALIDAVPTHGTSFSPGPTEGRARIGTGATLPGRGRRCSVA